MNERNEKPESFENEQQDKSCVRTLVSDSRNETTLLRPWFAATSSAAKPYGERKLGSAPECAC